MLEFEEFGNLTPYRIIDSSLTEFEEFFVNGLEDIAHRQGVYQNYLRFLDTLMDSCKGNFYQLLDGSFVTRKSKPKDIDLVTFLDLRLFKRSQSRILWLLENSNEVYGLDVFFVPIPKPFEHNYEKYLEAESYWIVLFSASREDENGIRLPKGIIKINFNYNEFKSRTIL